jgi:serine/threonine protein kinase/dienelactone hydrolase
MNPAARLEEEIFSTAIGLPPTERDAYLERHCRSDSATLGRVRALIEGYEKNSLFLEQPPHLEERLVATNFAAALPGEPVAGDNLGHYRIVQRIGEGGFGIVYLAEQTAPVRRRVALKLIRLGLDTREFIARFADERQALALMEHPNIARVFDAGVTATGRPYLVMEFIEGQPITRDCDARRLSLRARLELFVQVCGALQHAHEKGIIHRDLKPSNILVATEAGESAPKLIDFGIAKAMREPLTDRSLVTQQHALIGTPVYTSPEQIDVDGRESDPRSDIYSLGALLYELLTGTPPFEREALKRLGFEELRRTIREVEPLRPSLRVAAYSPETRKEIAALRDAEPATLIARLRSDIDWVVMRCLEKDPARRYATASALAADLRRYLSNQPVEARPPSRTYWLRKFVRRHRLAVAAGVAIVGIAVVGSLVTALQARRAGRAETAAADARRMAEAQVLRLEKIRWARTVALPEISQLLKKGDISGAFTLARQAEEFVPDDPALVNLWPSISATVSVETTPAGAEIYAKPYDQPASEWKYLGKSPLPGIRLPRSVHRWRIVQEGYEPIEIADGWWWIWDERRLVCTLYPKAATPPGMVRVQFRPTLAPARVPDFWIDRCEVTNREFKEFVAHGGYADPKFWKNAFVRDGESLSWSEAVATFRDATGQPGPAGWVNGTWPENQAEYPVTGISWFEAAAYAEFVGKRLPSITHWRQAAPWEGAEYLLAFSNFQSGALAPVGAYQGIDSCGAVDMFGNAKEWCWNETSDGRRVLLGGGWAEADYMFGHVDACSPFDRGPQNGFRCIKTDEGSLASAEVDAPFVRAVTRDLATERPVGDEQFKFIKRFYAYDRTNLELRVEGDGRETARWRRERVSFNAAYNGERMGALVYIPRAARPPYQAVVYFPGIGARLQPSSDSPRDLPVIEALLETGRVIVYPVYFGTYERRLSAGVTMGEIGGLEVRKHLVQDVLRTIDYLETRTDLQPGKVAFVGYSWGAELGPVVSALDPRIKANVFIAGGFTDRKILDEAEPLNFAPRVTAPTLMINGRQDFIRPLETSQLPFFRALGTPVAEKRHLLIEGGHGAPTMPAIPEIQSWLDRYLGPIERGTPSR